MRNLVTMGILATAAMGAIKLLGGPDDAQAFAAVVTLLFFLGLEIGDLRDKIK
jgi:hypothetical protein